MESHQPSASPRWPILGLWLCALPLLAAGTGNPAVWRTQEARVLQVAREMQDHPEFWLIPRFNGRIRVEKPPLAYWLAAASQQLLGPTEFAGRLPFAIAGWLTLAFIYAIGNHLFNQRVALLAAMILTSSFLFVRFSRLAETDILAALFTTSAVCCFIKAAPAHGKLRFALLHLAGISIGLAAMAKGPPALFPVLFVLAWAMVERNRPLLKSLLTSGMLLDAAVIGLWWWLYLFSTPQWPTILKELKAVTTGGNHNKIVLAYVPMFFQAMAPWSLLSAVGLLAMLWRTRSARALARRLLGKNSTRAQQIKDPQPQPADAGARAILLWFAAIVLPLCFAGNKQFHYLAAATLPAALAAAWIIDRALDPSTSHQQRRFIRYSLLLTVWTCGLAGAGILITAPIERGYFITGDFALAALTLAVALLAARAWLRRGPADGAITLAQGATVTLAIAMAWWLPSLRIGDHRTVAAHIRKTFGDGPYRFYGPRESISFPLIYNLGKLAPLIETQSDLLAQSSQKPSLVIITQTKNKLPPPQLPEPFVESFKSNLGDDGAIIRIYQIPQSKPK